MRRPLPSHAPHHLHHPRQIGLAHGGAGGQAQPIAEQRLGHTSPLPRREGPGEGHLAPLKDRLQVHRLPQRPRLDVLPLQRQADVFACGGPPTPQSWGKHIPLPQNWGLGGVMTVSQGVTVEREDVPFALHSLLQHAQLSATNGRQDVVEAVVFEAKVSWTNCCSRPDMWGRER